MSVIPHLMFEPDEVLQTLTGRGLLSAEGVEPARVRYKLVIERRDGVVRGHGTLVGNPAALRPIWLIPDAVLRLKDGREFPISVTDLVGDVAEFEGIGDLVPDQA